MNHPEDMTPGEYNAAVREELARLDGTEETAAQIAAETFDGKRPSAGATTLELRSPLDRRDGLIARLVDHILTDRAHMHCPLRAEVEAAYQQPGAVTA